MRKKYLNIIMCTSLLTLAGCSNEADIAIPDSAKQPIALAVGIESPMTRAVTLEKTNMEALPEGTDLWMVMKSEYVSLTDNALNFKGDQTAKYTVTSGVTGAADGAVNPITFGSGLTRYWDDAHARSSKLSVWSLAVPGKTGALSETAPWNAAAAWGTTAPSMTIDWTISSAQNSTTISGEDLCFSNNIADYSSTTGISSDNRMWYSNQQSLKFDQGKLIFYHALTKITINLVEGDGFDHTSTGDFNFDAGTAVALKGFNLSGTFDVAQGEFTSQTTSTAATTMACGDKTATGYTLQALVMPGRNLSMTLSDAVSFSIDKNAYTVSNAILLKALRDKAGNGIGSEWTTMEAGNNYIFTFTINKTGIKVISATVAKWNDVTADTYLPKINISQVYGHLYSADECADFTDPFALYLSTSRTSNYSKGTDVTYADSKYTMDTQLYWPNHETHYFFRGVYPAGTTVSESKIAVYNSSYNGTDKTSFPSNLMIGYPRKTDGTPDEACKVHSGTQGICATEGDIRMNFQYVMSQVEVKLKSVPSEVGKAETAKVTLDNNTTVEILNGYTSGSIALMNGVATGTGEKTDWTMLGGTYNDRHSVIVPQSLTDLKFRITVQDADGHKDSYEATIADIEVIPTGGTKGKITSWQPGKHYTYTLNITKTGIKITATLKDWETTTGSTNIWM